MLTTSENISAPAKRLATTRVKSITITRAKPDHHVGWRVVDSRAAGPVTIRLAGIEAGTRVTLMHWRTGRGEMALSFRPQRVFTDSGEFAVRVRPGYVRFVVEGEADHEIRVELAQRSNKKLQRAAA